MSANRTRVQVRGSIGKSVRFPTTPGSTGATIGVDLKLPDGSVPSLQQLAAALNTAAAIQDQPGNISPPGGGAGGTTLWQNIRFVPASVLNPPRPIQQTIDPDSPRVIPGPAGRDGVIGVNGTPGLTIPRFADEPDRPRMIPGPPGPQGSSGGGGSSVAVSDGVTTVSAVTAINFTSGATVTSGGTGIADVAVSGGGGGSAPFNVTPDTHPTTPAFVYTDEFEATGGFDTAGTRFSGATPWTVGSGVTGSQSKGAMTVSLSGSGVLQAALMTAPATPWSIVAKLSVLTAGSGQQGIVLYNSGNTNAISIGPWFSGPGPFGGVNFTGGSVTAANFSSGVAAPVSGAFLWIKIDNDGTNLTVSTSTAGGYGWTYAAQAIIPLATFIGAVTDFGLGGIGALTQYVDYLRGE